MEVQALQLCYGEAANVEETAGAKLLTEQVYLRTLKTTFCYEKGLRLWSDAEAGKLLGGQ